jgi:hypothetical protein
MKYYIQYLDVSPISGKIYEPCGDRAVVILDGRLSKDSMINAAHECNGTRRPQYAHFKIMRGDRFNSSNKVIYSTLN